MVDGCQSATETNWIAITQDNTKNPNEATGEPQPVQELIGTPWMEVPHKKKTGFMAINRNTHKKTEVTCCVA